MSNKLKLRFVATSPYLVEAIPFPKGKEPTHYCTLTKARRNGELSWTVTVPKQSEDNCFSEINGTIHTTFKAAQLQVLQTWTTRKTLPS